LLAVVGIFMVISAMALPNMMSAIYDFKLRSNVSSAAGVLQRTRMEAVRTNQTMGIQTGTVSGGKLQFYGDKNNNGSLDANEFRFVMPKEVSSPTAGAPGGLNGAGGFTNGLLAAGTVVRFNARGLPCNGAGNACNPVADGSGFVYYFRDSRPLGTNGWAALTVSPSGRVRTWWWTGTTWQ
jgi:type II secretory pathway pseudopilin PulG